MMKLLLLDLEHLAFQSISVCKGIKGHKNPNGRVRKEFTFAYKFIGFVY